MQWAFLNKIKCINVVGVEEMSTSSQRLAMPLAFHTAFLNLWNVTDFGDEGQEVQHGVHSA